MSFRENRHYAAEAWVDFVNEQIPKEQKAVMQAHLDVDCETCSRAFELWQRVSQTAQRESEYGAPESAVLHVRNAFIVAQPLKTQGRLEIPRLVMDSLWRPAVAGVRSAPCVPRQVVYRAGEIVIEMQLEPVPHTDRVNIAGQVSRAAGQDVGLAEIRVIVSTPRVTLAQASTNRFGEFQLGFVPEKNLRISFGVVDGKELSIPLDGTGVRIFHRN
jgi:hypothetical protein